MKKNELLIPIILACLGIAFVAVSLLVYFSKGKSAVWVSRKMRLGALIITLSSLGACDGCNNPPPTCYAQVATDQIFIDSLVNDTLKISKSENSTFTARISFPQSPEYSVNFVNSSGETVWRDDIFSSDSKIDSTTENFKINLNKELETGVYKMYFYDVSKKDQDSIKPLINYNVIISE